MGGTSPKPAAQGSIHLLRVASGRAGFSRSHARQAASGSTRSSSKRQNNAALVPKAILGREALLVDRPVQLDLCKFAASPDSDRRPFIRASVNGAD